MWSAAHAASRPWAQAGEWKLNAGASSGQAGAEGSEWWGGEDSSGSADMGTNQAFNMHGGAASEAMPFSDSAWTAPGQFGCMPWQMGPAMWQGKGNQWNAANAAMGMWNAMAQAAASGAGGCPPAVPTAPTGPSVEEVIAAAQDEAHQREVDSDNEEYDVYGRLKRRSDQGAGDSKEKEGKSAGMSKAERQNAALARLHARRRHASPRREEAPAASAAASKPAQDAPEDPSKSARAAVAGMKRKHPMEENALVSGNQWTCGYCGFRNRMQNACCGGTGNLGCKKPRY